MTEIKHLLNKPLAFGDNTINEIIISEPTYKTLKQCDLNDGQGTINKIIEDCNNLPQGYIDQISSKDYIELLSKVAESDFLG